MSHYRQILSALSLLFVFLTVAALAQEPAKKEKAKTPAAQSSANPVIGSGTPGFVSRWQGVSGSFTFTLGDSNIFEDKFGKIGIGTTAPTSLLTVQGMIEITLGGLKFPDGTVQSTAFNPNQVVRSLNRLTGDVQLAAGANITITPGGNVLTIATTGLLGSVTHGATLTGSGTAASPLDVTNGGIGAVQLGDGAVTAAKIASGQAVKSLNGIKDDVTLGGGSNITITPSGNTLTINTSGISQVVHDNTLRGMGTNAAALGVNIPLKINGSTPSELLFVDNTRGTGIRGAGDIGILGQLDGDGFFAGAFDGNVQISVDLLVIGDKDFVEPHPTDPSKMIAYVCLEGREAGTYFRGSGRIVNGSAVIDVPEDFRMVSDENGLTVQVTPVGAPATIWCVAKSLDRIELKSSADVEFDYTVNGVRKMSKDRKPIVENIVFVPRGPDDNLSERIRNPEAIRRMKASGILNQDGSVNYETVQKLDAYKRLHNRQ